MSSRREAAQFDPRYFEKPARSDAGMRLDAFATSRLLAERLRSDHLADIRAMDQSELFRARLGGVRDEAASVQYLERNLAHRSSMAGRPQY